MKKLLTIITLILMAITANGQNNHYRGIPYRLSDSNMKGDVDGDKVVNVTDVMMIVDYILGNTSNNFIAANADFDGDGTINITDGMSIVDYIIGINHNMICPDNNHPHAIDLGLPSGTKWSCCNVGAKEPGEYGGYYAWGEIEEKDFYNDVTYPYCTGEDIDGDGWYDEPEFLFLGSSICGTQYDVAHVQWGNQWQMPSREQIEELVTNSSCQWTMLNGIYGYRFTGPSNNCIFLPAAGSRYANVSAGLGSYGDYWSGSQYPQDNRYVYYLDFFNGSVNYNNYWGRSFGHSVRPISDPSLSFSLSENTVDLYINTMASVSILSGSGDYEIQNDKSDIIDAELVMADKEEHPDAKDEILIYGVAEGTAILSVIDKQNNKTSSVIVNMKTPTEEDIAITKDYVERVREFINFQEEMSVDDFQKKIISWLESKDWVKKVDLSFDKDLISITFENDAYFYIDFQYMSYLYDDNVETQSYVLSKISDDLPSYNDVTYQEGEEIIENANILYIQGRTMPNFKEQENSTADKEYEQIEQFCQLSPVKFAIKPEFKSLSFIEQSMEEYGMILLGQTHGVRFREFKSCFQVEDRFNRENTQNCGISIEIRNNNIQKSKDEPYIYNILPYVISNHNKHKIKEKTIFYGCYCYSYLLEPVISNTTFFGYETLERYDWGSEYMVDFFGKMSLGQTFNNAIEKSLKEYSFLDSKTYDRIRVKPKTNNEESKQRYFSIKTSRTNPGNEQTYWTVLGGFINGINNLKKDEIVFKIWYSDKPFEKPNDNLNNYEITIDDKTSCQYGDSLYDRWDISKDGTILRIWKYYPLSTRTGNSKLYSCLGFEYNGVIYHGDVRELTY